MTERGLKKVIVGRDTMEKGLAADVTSPEVTVTSALATVLIRSAGTRAVISVELTDVLSSAVLFQNTTESFPKPAPLTLSVKPPPPAVAVAGSRRVITGRLLIVKCQGADVAPPTVIVMSAVPACAILSLGTVAVNCSRLTKAAGSESLFHRM